MCVYLCACAAAGMYVYVYIYIYIYMHKCMYLYVYVYMHENMNSLPRPCTRSWCGWYVLCVGVCCMYVCVYTYVCIWGGVATMSMLLQIIGLFCRISSLS